MNQAVLTATVASERAPLGRIVFASALGTVFEWYEFFLFGAMASIIAAQFFAGVNETAGFIFTLLTFAAGFAMRPLGALLFGRMGDRAGRKTAFLATIVMMGLATVAIGLLPTYAQVGALAPALLVTLRMLQGVALGGEYGGAATYVAEHAPAHRRGYYTSLVHGAAAIGLVLALIVIYLTRTALGEQAFRDWAWRIPFLLSLAVLLLSVWARSRLDESPAFSQLQRSGALAKAPVSEALLHWPNLRLILIALFGFMAADGAIWYAAHFYAQFFLERTLRVEPSFVNLLFIALASLAAPLYVLFGWLSDRIGRKPVMIAGIALALVSYIPLYHVLANAANPALIAASKRAPVVVFAPAGDCTLQFDPVGTADYTTACDVARRTLAGAGVSYRLQSTDSMSTSVRIGVLELRATDQPERYSEQLRDALDAAGYPRHADAEQISFVVLLGCLLLLAIPAAALLGPLGAALVELFPTRVRYTAMSLPYHIGTGWFGGFMPAIAFSIVAASGDIFSGLYYVIGLAVAALPIALFCWPETRGRDLVF